MQLIIIPVLDEMPHTASSPCCSDVSCPCHEDSAKLAASAPSVGKTVHKLNDPTKWQYRVVVEHADYISIVHFEVKEVAERHFEAVISHVPDVLRATCDRGTAAYKRYDSDKQPRAERSI